MRSRRNLIGGKIAIWLAVINSVLGGDAPPGSSWPGLSGGQRSKCVGGEGADRIRRNVILFFLVISGRKYPQFSLRGVILSQNRLLGKVPHSPRECLSEFVGAFEGDLKQLQSTAIGGGRFCAGAGQRPPTHSARQHLGQIFSHAPHPLGPTVQAEAMRRLKPQTANS
jgi:hypothetical protein